MKRFLARTFIAACIIFTLMFIFSLPFAYFFTGPNTGLTIASSMLVAALVGAFFQGLWFSGAVFTKLHYGIRACGFILTFAPSLFACAWIGKWFPLSVGSIISFFVLFLVLFVIILIGYTLYFRKTSGSYQKALEKYRKSQKERKA